MSSLPAELVTAIDLGGTKIAGALVDRAGRLAARVERPTPARGTAAEMLDAVRAVTDALAGHPGWAATTAVGIGSAGPVDIAAGTVSPVNIPSWREFPLAGAVAEHTGRPVVLIGDGNAFAAGEHWLGAARGQRHVLGMVVSTGVGGGLVLDGRIHAGPTGNAGHIGHISVDFGGDRCPCGGRGCVELLASGTHIARHAREAGWRPGPGEPDSAAGVAAAARRGEPAAVAAFDRSARALAAAIAATAALVEIETAVIGGGVSRAGDVLFGPLRRALADYTGLPFTRHVRVAPARLGGDAGLLGAAAACWAARPGTGTAAVVQAGAAAGR
ncbi:ROK family protein [Streptomyces aidingensis]|uniref:Glucokinase n=1 Tax=Streptomyces aidingensis TaxID=910347 RepID=A0A1I1SIX8_9ACTN|nr:ROK family protein [Streptomyces aidingensis]SFD46391.1 glucokinase [Streptomyces aidingensis]